MNAWYPRLRNDGVMASGNTSVWLTDLDGTARELGVGGWPVWAGQVLVFNGRDGTTKIGANVPPLPQEYNEYVGSDVGQWAGFVAGVGRVDRYVLDIANTSRAIRAQAIDGACLPRFCGALFGYLFPYQAEAQGHIRTLFLDNAPRHTDTIIDWCANKGGGCYLYTVARGTYGRRIFDQRGNDCTIREQQDETPYVVFIGPDGYPWMASWTPTHTIARMIYSASGYVWAGDFLNADCRMIGKRAHLVGSDNAGQLREAWIDFDAPRVDVRKV